MSIDLTQADTAALTQAREEAERRYEEFAARGLALDMTRGKPCPEQLDLANGLLTEVTGDSFKTASGTDTRNYGGLDGLPEAKALFAGMLGLEAGQVLLGGNSSLQMMYDAVARALLLGVPGGKGPWRDEAPVKFLCPAPGYDRHFGICEHFGIEMIAVPMGPEGPDMDEVERLAGSDASVKGIWCVPKYANPTGVTYSDAVVERFARMETAASDFRIFWDNAYAVHDLVEDGETLADIHAACDAAGCPDRVYQFASTSKISFAGAGVGLLAASEANLEAARAAIQKQTIGPDKINQLRHVRFFKTPEGIAAHMRKHAAIIRPKFEAVLEILQSELAGSGLATWTEPRGGYFVSMDVLPGCAAEVGRLAGEAGVKLTKAGATFPYGKDPKDSNIRIAPTLPGLDEIRTAMELVCVCVQLAATRSLLQKA
jgi:aspartate/methionine/tyrosine aminotransferase